MSSITPNNFFNYFKECYKIDNKEFIVDNILAIKYKNKWFAKTKESIEFQIEIKANIYTNTIM